ncbi:YHS domain-containing (seleno)protein [Devosia pacifica]|nr:YHS domain-containing (seleno)protein [Devosia pacifica]
MGQTKFPPVDTNPLTGVALDGYDPVSYFTEAEPLLGSEEFELMWAGVPWHFANGANMAIFERAPEVYAPQYGGHGAMGMARGFLAQGDPRYYAVFKQRLFIFYSAANREAFLLAPDAAALEGQVKWRDLTGAEIAAER